MDSQFQRMQELESIKFENDFYGEVLTTKKIPVVIDFHKEAQDRNDAHEKEYLRLYGKVLGRNENR